jgi:uncharacterized protein RhaS with RHS repeats
LGRPLTETRPGGRVTAYTYASLAGSASVADEAGETTAYAYDKGDLIT